MISTDSCIATTQHNSLLNTKIIGKKITCKARLLDKRDFQHLIKVVNWAYRGKEGHEQWASEENLIFGDRVTYDMLLKDIEKDKNLCTVIVVEEYIDQEENGEGCDQQDKILQPIGCVKIERDTIHDKPIIGMLSVDPSYQSKGIGAILMTLAEKEIKQVWNVDEAHLHVVNVRDGLLGWYRYLGYVENGERYPFNIPGTKILVDEELEFLILIKKL
ncbi:hypothetical protein CYY_010215 [Polysphondylium violaceum]|uniref:N-acetyltransferase domain-containing protein n=1 Tax=Polysphondylium violaceum TaxID=133409 RepID=A0A8J4V204_9MYCE|nr:hypothetical protein CYY_010215 [Polysphondylium violaceum]